MAQQGRHVTSLVAAEVLLRDNGCVPRLLALSLVFSNSNMSVGRQRLSLASSCAVGCALLALPVLLPLLFAISPILFLAGVVWFVWSKKGTGSSEEVADPPSKPSKTSKLLADKSVDGAEPPALPPKPLTDSSVSEAKSNNAKISKGSTASSVPHEDASSNASSVKSTKIKDTPRAAAPAQARPGSSNKSEAAQPAAAPATGSAALLARIRFAHLSCQHTHRLLTCNLVLQNWSCESLSIFMVPSTQRHFSMSLLYCTAGLSAAQAQRDPLQPPRLLMQLHPRSCRTSLLRMHLRLALHRR